MLPLDMAKNSVDDQYRGCIEKMLRLVKDKYLAEELLKLPNFNSAWKKGEIFCEQHKNDILLMDHCIALNVYTDDHKVYQLFNDDTRIGRANYTKNKYKYYSLHFLLTDAVHRLRMPCNTTYRGVGAVFEKNVVNKKFRFGSFTSSSFSKTVAMHFGRQSCFKITTCYGVSVRNYSTRPYQEEVLIPPYEVFRVTDVSYSPSDFMCNTVYTVKSIAIRSNLNCELTTEPWYVWFGVAIGCVVFVVLCGLSIFCVKRHCF